MLSLIRRYFSLLLPFLWRTSANRWATLATCALTLLDMLAATAAPWLFSRVVASHAQSCNVYVFAFTLLCCWPMMRIGRHLRNVVFFRVVNHAIRDIRFQLILHLHKAMYQGDMAYQPTEILSASTRVSMGVRGTMRVSMVDILPALLKLGSLTLALSTSHPHAVWFCIAIVLISWPTYLRLGMFLQSRKTLWDVSDHVFVAMRESLHQVHANRLQQQCTTQRLRRLFDEEQRRWWNNNCHEYGIYILQALLYFGCAGLWFITLVVQLQRGQLPIAQLILIKGYLLAIYKEIFNVTRYFRSLLGYVLDFRKVLDILALPLDSRPTALLPSLTDSSVSVIPAIQCQKAAFQYAGYPRLILKDTTLHVPRGAKIAITGASGGGKTTLCHLMAGIYTPTQGEVRINGYSTQTFAPTALGRQLYFIAQDATPFAGSIEDNLIRSLPAQARFILGHLAKQGRRIMGENGKKLSGGEKQRILLACCLAAQPEIAILDESLICFDKASASQILDTLFAHIPTLVLVTHDSALLHKFTYVYTLAAGKLTRQ